MNFSFKNSNSCQPRNDCMDGKQNLIAKQDSNMTDIYESAITK